MYEFTERLQPWERCDNISKFKRSKAGLNSEFSFSYSGCVAKATEYSMLYYLFLSQWVRAVEYTDYSSAEG